MEEVEAATVSSPTQACEEEDPEIGSMSHEREKPDAMGASNISSGGHCSSSDEKWDHLEEEEEEDEVSSDNRRSSKATRSL